MGDSICHLITGGNRVFDGARKCAIFFFFAFSLHVGTAPNCFPDMETVLSFFILREEIVSIGQTC